MDATAAQDSKVKSLVAEIIAALRSCTSDDERVKCVEDRLTGVREIDGPVCDRIRLLRKAEEIGRSA